MREGEGERVGTRQQTSEQTYSTCFTFSSLKKKLKYWGENNFREKDSQNDATAVVRAIRACKHARAPVSSAWGGVGSERGCRGNGGGGTSYLVDLIDVFQRDDESFVGDRKERLLVSSQSQPCLKAEGRGTSERTTAATKAGTKKQGKRRMSTLLLRTQRDSFLGRGMVTEGLREARGELTC